jgi:hypothetical protein
MHRFARNGEFRSRLENDGRQKASVRGELVRSSGLASAGTLGPAALGKLSAWPDELLSKVKM